MCVYAFAYVYTCICVLAYACAFPHGHSELPLVELVSSALCDNAEEFIPLKLYHSCTQAVPWFSIQDMLHTDGARARLPAVICDKEDCAQRIFGPSFHQDPPHDN